MPCYRGRRLHSSAVASLSLQASLCGECAAGVVRIRVSVSGRAGGWFDSGWLFGSVRCRRAARSSGEQAVVVEAGSGRRRCSRGVAVSVCLQLCVWIPRGLGRQRMASRHRQREAHDNARYGCSAALAVFPPRSAHTQAGPQAQAQSQSQTQNRARTGPRTRTRTATATGTGTGTGGSMPRWGLKLAGCGRVGFPCSGLVPRARASGIGSSGPGRIQCIQCRAQQLR